MLQKFQYFINEKKQVVDPRTIKVRESLPKEIWHELLGFQKEIMRNEVDSEEFVHVLENKKAIYTALQDLGFKYITLDIMGFRSGSLNE